MAMLCGASSTIAMNALGGRLLGGYQGTRARTTNREVHLMPERLDVGSLMERMILGEVREQSAGLLDHRQGELIAERHQRLVGLDLLAGTFGEHDRVL